MPSYTITSFGGLNETDPPDEIGLEAAQALNNVAWDNSIGAIRRRWGSANFAGAESNAYQTLFAHSATRLLGTHGTTLEAYTEGGASSTTQAIAAASVSYAKIGTPSATYTFVADGTNTLWSYDGTSIASGASAATVDGVGSRAMPKGIHLAVDTDSNRLVVAGTASSGGPHGATSGGSHVWFSDPGAPFTWSTTNFVYLTPGDGESIVGACTWQGDVYVFKRTKLFIFYGESTDVDGNPIFNYRTVDLSDDLRTWGGGGRPICAASNQGVFYAGERGVFLTTGDQPIRVSDELDWGDSSQSTAAVGASVSVAGDKLYVGRNAGSAITDTFVQTSGSLAGKTTDTGETWAGAGDSTDFAINTTDGTAQRTAVSDSDVFSGRLALAGSSAYTNVTVETDVKFSVAVGDDYGVLARYVDSSNWVAAALDPTSSTFEVRVVISGANHALDAVLSAFYSLPATDYRIRLSIDAAGTLNAWVGFRGYDFSPSPTITFQLPELATGGTLASGKVGLYDATTTATAVTRDYDNFFASTSSPAGVYELDLETDQWAKHDILTNQAPIGWLDTRTLYSDYTAKRVRFLDDPAYDDDAGTDITASWTSGISTFGYEGEKALKYVDVWGTGTVEVSVASDFGIPANQETLTLGTSEVTRARYKTSVVGTFFGVALAAIDGAAFKVHRITLHYDERPDQRSIR